MGSDAEPESGGRLDRAYSLQNAGEAKQLYAEWAETFEADFVQANDFHAHIEAAARFVAAGGRGPVLDFGCGTGIVGVELARLGAEPIDGADLSPEMLAVASRKRVYRNLLEGDVLDGYSVPDETYAGVVSSGTFTHGHVGPGAIGELLRISQAGAQFSLTINGEYFVEAGFESAFAALADRITDLELVRVRFYGPGATGPHRNDEGYIALFRKR